VGHSRRQQLQVQRRHLSLVRPCHSNPAVLVLPVRQVYHRGLDYQEILARQLLVLGL
jgi:hypothetical protein